MIPATSELRSARSLLFVPGDRPERFSKALATSADGVILDFENAVADADKGRARELVQDYLDRAPREPSRLLIRVNAAGTPDYDADLTIAAHPTVAGVMLPKAESAAEVSDVAKRCGKPVWCLIETAAGLDALREITGAAGVARLILGTIDLALDLDLVHGSEGCERMLDQARYQMAVQSRIARLPAPIDGVYADIKNSAGLTRMATFARQAGFGGMLCIHPSQTDTVNAAFAPSDSEIAWAERVMAATKGQKGAFSFEGQMVDAPIIARAERLIARGGGRT